MPEHKELQQENVQKAWETWVKQMRNKREKWETRQWNDKIWLGHLISKDLEGEEILPKGLQIQAGDEEGASECIKRIEA